MTPLGPSFYNWTSPFPGLYHRPALSTEALWSTRPKELHEIFVTAKLSLVTPKKRCALKLAAVRAWRLLRYEVPELGVSAVVRNGEVFLESRGIDERGMEEWMPRTLFYEEGDGGECEFNALRRDISSRKDDEEQASILLNFSARESSNGEQGLIDTIHIILNTDHQITDGIGTRILLGRFLELFSWCIGDGLESEDLLVWADSNKNLTKPWIEMLNEKQKLEGEEFDEVVGRKRDYLYHKISPKINPSLPIKETAPSPTTASSLLNPQISTQKTHFLTLSLQETTSLLTALKKINLQTNITHAVHAAMALTLLKTPNSDILTFNSSCWLNGRRYLSPSEKLYIPLCQSFFPISFTTFEDICLSRNPGKEEKKGVMIKTLEMALEQYLLLKEEGEMGLVLGSMVKTGEEIGRDLRARRQAGKGKKESAVPLFLSDGITEGYISRSYTKSESQGKGEESQRKRKFQETQVNQEEEKEEKERSVFEVEDIHFGANAGGEVILRIATFRSQLRISVEWKEELFDGDMVREFLEGVRSFLMSLL